MKYKKLISHRGNLSGASPDSENTPLAIEDAIINGYDCEVDLWLSNKKLHLGHDYPQTEISINFLEEAKKNLWIHCKNYEALNFLSNQNADFNYFWHEDDKFTLTSKGYIWTYPNNIYSKNSVIVHLDENLNLKNDCYGICSDYVSRY